MQICQCSVSDLPQVKKIWMEIFKDSEKFTNFAVSLGDVSQIYLVKEDDCIAAMLNGAVDLTAGGKKGFYIYGVATLPQFRGRGYASELIKYVCDEKFKQGYDFALTQPADENLFKFYEKLGFDNKTYLRKFTVDIKRNLWATADFDTVTANKFKSVRDKFSEDTVVHFTDKGYEKFAEYIYTEGGSTAETPNAYCIYFEEKDRLIVRELFATQTVYAIELLQAIRERTGKERADIQLSENSSLFLGEGKLYPHTALKNLKTGVYANLMFD